MDDLYLTIPISDRAKEGLWSLIQESEREIEDMYNCDVKYNEYMIANSIPSYRLGIINEIFEKNSVSVDSFYDNYISQGIVSDKSLLKCVLREVYNIVSD